MQFKNPEILYFLALLIIPIIVHLFQLQKFVKVPFSNVAFLKKIVQQTRKSSRIKKWLILTNRLLLFIAILFAFSQPYLSDKKETKKQHTFIYLDNSLSTNTEGAKGNLLKIASQEIIKNTSEKDIYSLQTNDTFYEKISKGELKKTLLKSEKHSNSAGFSYASNHGTSYGGSELWSVAANKIAVSSCAWYLFAKHNFNPFATGKKQEIPKSDIFWIN